MNLVLRIGCGLGVGCLLLISGEILHWGRHGTTDDLSWLARFPHYEEKHQTPGIKDYRIVGDPETIRASIPGARLAEPNGYIIATGVTTYRFYVNDRIALLSVPLKPNGHCWLLIDDKPRTWGERVLGRLTEGGSN